MKLKGRDKHDIHFMPSAPSTVEQHTGESAGGDRMCYPSVGSKSFVVTVPNGTIIARKDKCEIRVQFFRTTT
jgi:hypothetical protein